MLAGRYNVLETISTSGLLGDLLRARDTATGRTVALRVVRDEIATDPASREALLAAASDSMKLSHPHIAALFEARDDEGRLYLAHEYVPGQRLDVMLASRSLDPHAAAHLAAQLADALAEAHRHGVPIRTLSAGSVMVTPRDQAKLLDAGLGEWTSGSRVRQKTTSELAAGRDWSDGAFAGALNRPASYLSPEQALGNRGDARSDVFALGVLIYQMLTGQVPFGGSSDTATALKVVYATPPAPGSINPSVPPQLDALVSRMLLKSLDARPSDAAALAVDLRKAVKVTALAPVREDATPERPSRLALAVTLVAAAAAIGVAVGWWLWRG
jgi:serine/threonine-protein kinase